MMNNTIIIFNFKQLQPWLRFRTQFLAERAVGISGLKTKVVRAVGIHTTSQAVRLIIASQKLTTQLRMTDKLNQSNVRLRVAKTVSIAKERKNNCTPSLYHTAFY